jgi:hypothetical protein
MPPNMAANMAEEEEEVVTAMAIRFLPLGDIFATVSRFLSRFPANSEKKILPSK